MTKQTGIARSLALFGATVAGLAGAGTAEAQLSVSPIIVEMVAEQVAETRTISVTNNGDKPLSVRLYAGDFEQMEAGEHEFEELGELPASCAGRIRVYPDQASLLPGETQGVRVEMAPGAETCWSAVFVETASIRNGALIRQRIAAKVYGVSPTARAEGEVARVALTESAEGKKVAVTFQNLGEKPLRPQGMLEIRDFNGEVVAKTEIDAFSALPGRMRTVEVPLSMLPRAGEYIAVPVLDFGGEYLAGGQLAFELSTSDVLVASAPRPRTDDR